jgi:hypothetical protein
MADRPPGQLIISGEPSRGVTHEFVLIVEGFHGFECGEALEQGRLTHPVVAENHRPLRWPPVAVREIKGLKTAKAANVLEG